MTYLYGDSTPASVENNFLEFLRDAVGCLADIAHASHGIVEQRERATVAEREAAEDLRRLEALDAFIRRALAGAPPVPRDSPAARCAHAIGDRSSELIAAERDGVEARLSREIARGQSETASHLASPHRALEALLARHDLPETRWSLVLRAEAEGPFNARLKASTHYGITSEIELDIPSGHLFAQPLRLDRVVERMEVHAPDLSGWISKSVKLKPQRFDRYHLILFVVSPTDARLELRAMPDGKGDGFDLTCGARISITRISEQGDTIGEPTEPDEKETESIRGLVEKLRTAALDLRSLRKRLVDARLDGDAVSNLSEPAHLIDRLVGAIGPTVREIAKHSLSPDELVLKRLLAGGKREEFFVSKRELREVLADAPPTLHGRFAPLGLGIGGDGGSATTSVVHGPAPERESEVVAIPVSKTLLETVQQVDSALKTTGDDDADIEISTDDDSDAEFETREEEVTMEISVSGLLPTAPSSTPAPAPAIAAPSPKPAIDAPPLKPSGELPRPSLPPRPSTPPVPLGPPRPRK